MKKAMRGPYQRCEETTPDAQSRETMIRSVAARQQLNVAEITGSNVAHASPQSRSGNLDAVDVREHSTCGIPP